LWRNRSALIWSTYGKGNFGITTDEGSEIRVSVGVATVATTIDHASFTVYTSSS
jgi:hypothetical protein